MDYDFKIHGGDEYFWIGNPPIITVKPHSKMQKAPVEPERDFFMGSFFEKDVAIRGITDD